jgi:NAD(P)-dependent dehydrogenase (short-subunit alcohol dehydrogenase family)
MERVESQRAVTIVFCYAYSLSIEDMPLAHWRETIDINLTGTMLVTRTILPFMIARRLVVCARFGHYPY